MRTLFSARRYITFLLSVWLALPLAAQTRDSIACSKCIPVKPLVVDTTQILIKVDTVPVVVRFDSTYAAKYDTVMVDSIVKVPVPPTTHPNNPGLPVLTERDFLSTTDAGWTLCNQAGARFSIVNDLSVTTRGTPSTGVATFPAGWKAGSGPICTQKDFGHEVSQVYLDFDFTTSTNWFGQGILDKIGYVTTTTHASGPVFFGVKGPGSQRQVFQIHVSAAVTGSNNPRILSGGSLTRGKVARIEMLLTLNTCNVANGAAQVWIDGQLAITASNVMFRSSAFGCQGFRMTKWSPVWGGTSGVIPAQQTQSIGYWFSAGQ